MMDIATRLRLKGFRISIDDFGTGYSSLVQLQRLPFSEMKIDKSFVIHCATSRESLIIVKSIIDLAHNRSEVWRRVMLSRAGTFGGVFNGDFSAAVQLDAEKLVAQFLRDLVPDDFEALKIPLTVVASNLYGRREVTFDSGSLKPALAASIALPGIMRPVVVGDRVLIDGGATNPLPFDLLRGRGDIIVAVDISGPPAGDRKDLPSAIETLYASVLVMTSAIINEKLKRDKPDLLVTPNVGAFRALDFFQASAILRVAEATKTDLKAKLETLLGI